MLLFIIQFAQVLGFAAKGGYEEIGGDAPALSNTVMMLIGSMIPIFTYVCLKFLQITGTVADAFHLFLQKLNRPLIMLVSSRVLGDPGAIANQLLMHSDRMAWTVFGAVADSGTVSAYISSSALTLLLTFAPSLNLFEF